MKVSELGGRAVVDIERGQKLGQVDDVVVDPRTGEVAGLVVSIGSRLLGQHDDWLIAAARVHAIGEDAVTVHGAAVEDAALQSLPRFGELKRFKIATDAGRALGSLADAELDASGKRVVRYVLSSGGVLAELARNPADQGPGFLPGDTELRVGQDLILVGAGAVPAAESSLPRSAGAPPTTGGRPTAPTAPDPERDYADAQRRLQRLL